MNIINKKTLIALALGTALTSMAGAANAFTWHDSTKFEDNDYDRLIDVNGNGFLDVGDSLSAVYSIDNIINNLGIGEQNVGIDVGATEEVTGLAVIKVLNITDSNGDGVAERIQFGPDASFEAIYGTGAMFTMFNQGPGNLDIQNDATDCTSILDCEAKATDGTHLLTMGIGDADDEWFATNALLNVGIVSTLSDTSTVAFFNYALSILENTTGRTFADQSLDCVPGVLFNCFGDGKSKMLGNGDVKGGRGLDNGYDARSDIDYDLVSSVPEPTSIALLGMGLLAFGARASKRRV